MLKSLYERSMRDGGDRHANRVLAISMVVVAVLALAVGMVPIQQVEQLTGEVVPAAVHSIMAPADGWVEVDGDIEGRRVEADETLGWWWPELGLVGLEGAAVALTAGMPGEVLGTARRRRAEGPFWARRGAVIGEVYDPDRLVVQGVLDPGRRLEPASARRVLVADGTAGTRMVARITRGFLRRGEGGDLEQVLELEAGTGKSAAAGAGLVLGRQVSVRAVLGTRRLWRRGLSLVAGGGR